ncbi:MAG: cyclic nucleotide-binding domain-containing protein, partial [Pseudomonadota bacterium]
MPRLRAIRLFSGVADDVLMRIEQRCRWHRFSTQQLILDRDTESRDVFFVLEGKVRVVNYTRSGREIAFAVLGAESSPKWVPA